MESAHQVHAATNYMALSLFRIALAAFLFVDFELNVRSHYQDFFGPAGVLPLSDLVLDGHVWGLPLLLPFLTIFERLGLTSVLPYGYPLCLALFALGYRTRLALAAVFAFHSFLFWRNPYLRSGAEVLAQALLLWCFFVPINRYFSIDSALQNRAVDRPHEQIGITALRLQVTAVYVFSGLYKLLGTPWRDGSAVELALSDTIFGSTPIGLLFISHLRPLLYVANFAIVAFQIGFPLLVYAPFARSRLKAGAIGLAAAMHLSFIFFLNVGSFPYISLLCLLVLIPDAWLPRVVRASAGSITIYYDPPCGFCRKISLILREFVLAGRGYVHPAGAHAGTYELMRSTRSWIVRDAQGHDHLKMRGLLFLLKQNVLSRPLGVLLDRRSLHSRIDAIYDWIGNQRPALSGAARVLLPERSERPLGPASRTCCIVLSAIMLLSNVEGLILRATSIQAPPAVQHLVAALQMRQRWALFAPVPSHYRWDFALAIVSPDGVRKDLVPLLDAPPFRTYESGKIEFASRRWLKYFTNFDQLSEEAWTGLGRYLCRYSAGMGATTIELSIGLTPVVIEGPRSEERHQFDCPSLFHAEA